MVQSRKQTGQVGGQDTRGGDVDAHAASHTDGSDDIQDATASVKGVATATQIAKLDAIASGAEVNAAPISQADAEAGTATAEAMFTAQRVKQAIDALGGGGGKVTPIVLTHTSDTALATQASGGSAMATASAQTIPTAGVIRLTMLEIEVDETEGNIAFGAFGIKIGSDAVIWSIADEPDGTSTYMPRLVINASVSSLVLKHGLVGADGLPKTGNYIMNFDIVGEGMSTGTQDIVVYMADNVDGRVGEITVTGTTVTARFLVEILDAS